MSHLRRSAAAALAALLLTAGACSSDDTADPEPSDASTGSDPTTDASNTGSTDTGSSDAGGNPCAVITQEQWEAIFGDGVTKAEGSGGPDNCNVLTSGTSPGHEISLTNLAAAGTTSFDQAVSSSPGCSGTPADLDIADQAVVDTSCLEVSGRAWVVAADGDDILLVSLDLAEPATGDPDAIAETFSTVAAEVIAAR